MAMSDKNAAPGERKDTAENDVLYFRFMFDVAEGVRHVIYDAIEQYLNEQRGVGRDMRNLCKGDYYAVATAAPRESAPDSPDARSFTEAYLHSIPEINSASIRSDPPA